VQTEQGVCFGPATSQSYGRAFTMTKAQLAKIDALP